MKTKKIARFSILTALALILSYIESLVPMSFAVPGIKLGLPNIVVVFALYKLGVKEAAVISVLRVILVAILFGNAYSLLYSLTGAIMSIILMILMKSTDRFGITGVSVSGAIVHNLGQILVAVFVLETGKLIYYFPALCVSGVVTGICIGLIATLLTKRIKV